MITLIASSIELVLLVLVMVALFLCTFFIAPWALLLKMNILFGIWYFFFWERCMKRTRKEEQKQKKSKAHEMFLFCFFCFLVSLCVCVCIYIYILLKTHVLEKSSNSTVKVLASWGTSMTFISCVLKINYFYLYLKIKMLILLQAFGH